MRRLMSAEVMPLDWLAMGDGGAVFTSDEDLAIRIAAIASHGAKKKYHSEMVGINSRLDEIQAAVLRIKLRHIDECLSRRRAAALKYRKALTDCDFVVCPQMADGHTFNQFTLHVNYGCRDDMREFLTQQGVSSMIYFPEPIHHQPVFGTADNLPMADEAAKCVLSLPMHTELTDETISQVAAAVNSFHIGAHRGR